MENILIASRNKGKIKELETLFQKFNINVQSLYDLRENVLEIEETGTTFQENARLKAEQIATLLNRPVIADDSGLVIDALNGEPGVYSARYAGEKATDDENNEE